LINGFSLIFVTSLTVQGVVANKTQLTTFKGSNPANHSGDQLQIVKALAIIPSAEKLVLNRFTPNEL